MAGMKSHRKSNSKRELKPELGREEEIYRNGYVLDIVENYVNWKVSDGEKIKTILQKLQEQTHRKISVFLGVRRRKLSMRFYFNVFLFKIKKGVENVQNQEKITNKIQN